MFAELTELQERWRTLTAEEQLRAQRLLDDASRMVARLYPTVSARVTDPDFARDVAMVVCNMVRRSMERPADGLAEETERRGPFAITRRFSNPGGELDFTANEEAILEGRSTVTVALPIWTGTC